MERHEKFHGRINRENAPCEWLGCIGLGEFKAPNKINVKDGLRWFCLEHIREFNSKYNFFEDMTESEIEGFQMDAFSWHRPTWKLGEKHTTLEKDIFDPFDLDAENKFGLGLKKRGPLNRPLKSEDLVNLATLGLDHRATGAEIKCQYKVLVKKFHPDTNKGSEKSANQLREVVEAYNYLK